MNYVLAGRSIGQVLGRSAGAASNGLLTNLVAYWKLDEASGNAIDAHTNGLTLTAANAPGADTGKVYATARTFNGSNQYFSRASEAATNIGDVSFSLAVWVYLDSVIGSGKTIVNKSVGSTGNRGYALSYLPTISAFRFFVRNIADTASGFADATTFGAASTGQWYFVVGVHDATNDSLAIYVNNIAGNSIAWTGGVLTNSIIFQIGAGEGAATNPLSGRIGPVAFWKNRTLNAADRTLLWNGGAGLAYSAFS